MKHLHEQPTHHPLLFVQISFGGLPVSAKPNTGGRENFVGCMEGITYNGENITNLVRRKKVDTSSFVSTFSDCFHFSVLLAFVGQKVMEDNQRHMKRKENMTIFEFEL